MLSFLFFFKIFECQHGLSGVVPTNSSAETFVKGDSIRFIEFLSVCTRAEKGTTLQGKYLTSRGAN